MTDDHFTQWEKQLRSARSEEWAEKAARARDRQERDRKADHTHVFIRATADLSKARKLINDAVAAIDGVTFNDEEAELLSKRVLGVKKALAAVEEQS
jgi:hypothetical protein